MENSSSGGSSAIVQFRDKGNMGIKENKTLLGRDWNIISLPFRGTTKLVKKKKERKAIKVHNKLPSRAEI